MCKVTINESLNPSFVLYNLVFGNNSLKTVDASSLHACMEVYGVPMPEKSIEKKLMGWYRVGLLRERDGSYAVA